MLKTLVHTFAVLRAAISANRSLQHMQYAQMDDMDTLKSAFFADLNARLDETETVSIAPDNGALISA
jgi:hypothetical protein